LIALCFVAGFIVVNQGWRWAAGASNGGSKKIHHGGEPSEEYYRRVLGVNSDADQHALRAAYDARLSKYDPAKFVEFGPEFEAAAVERTEVVVTAYKYLLQRTPVQ
jgi:DnaJ-domain-containing protein 1